MGLRLKNELRVLHFIFALTLPLALLLLLGCKQAHEERADLGPTADPSLIDSTFAKAIHGASIATLQVNQMVHYEESLRVANQDPNILIGEHGVSVIDRSIDNDTQEVRITVHHSQSIREPGKSTFTDVESEDTLALPDPAQTTGLGMLMAVDQGFQPASLTAADTPQPIRITYHNFQTSSDTITPPDAVVKRSSCGGLSPCKLPVTYISYDEVKWYSDTNYDKYHYDFAFTSELPYMSGLLGVLVTGCIGYYQTSSGKRYYMRDCQYLTDFQK